MDPPDMPAHESGVLRYYSSSLSLRVLTTDAASSRAAAAAPFLSLTESHLVAPLVRAPSVAVVGAGEKLTRGVFTVLPAEGFVKQRGEPVYYNEPIQLMDERGRLLGIATRAPFAGHLAADGHSGALVFVLERHAPRRHAAGDRFRLVKQHSDAFRRSLSGTSSSDGSSTPESDDTHMAGTRMSSNGAPTPLRSSLVQVCGGDRLRISGLTRVVKKQYPGGCIMQPKLEDGGRTSRKSVLADDESPSLLCEVVLTSTPSSLTRSDSTSSSSSTTNNQIAADRTATGDYVGVLHTGILHRRSDHMKLWKKRFFVLTQVALHRFDAHETLHSVRTQKARGSISLADCRSVRYERFSRPHELELELSNGKVFALHAEDALTCSEWASVLSRAIENPHWVHAERNCLTVWRSDAQYESPQCPVVTKVVLRRGTPDKPFTCCGVGRGEPDAIPVASSPQWSEKLTLGSITASGSVAVQLTDGNVFRLTLEDLSRSLVQPRWLAVATSLEVGRIHAVGDDDAGGPQSGGHKSESDDDHKADKSRFLVRLKFQADLQLDQRLGHPRRSLDAERRLVLGVTSALVLVPAVVCGFYHSLNPLARSLCLVSASLVVAALIAVAPVAWQLYLWLRYGDSMEGELHWFLTLLAIEVRPHSDEISDRRSTLSGEENRLRLSSFIHNPGDDEEQDEEDGDDSEDGAIVVPTKTPLYGLEASLLQDGSHPRASPQAIRAFRLENALDTILARPLLSFFAMKSFFPSTFLPRDAHGRRVLLVSLNETDRHGLADHNISGFNVVRYFLYLWEFMWSYQDLHEGVNHSKLVVVVDCSGWPYFKWFSIECQVMLLLLNTTYRFYPNRLARVVFLRNQVSFGIYGRLFRKGLDPGLRDLVETCEMMPSSFAKGDTPSPDETALREFVTNVLATHANSVIPRFTRRELEQATRLTTTGSLHVDSEDSRLDAIGTLAVVVPTSLHATLVWQPVVDRKDFAMWKSTDPDASVAVQGKTYQSDARAVQWRGRYTMKTTNADHVVKTLQDPRAATGWLGGDAEQLVVLETLSPQEDVSFWSRRVPFMNFSLSGHRVAGGSGTNSLSHTPTNAFYHSVLRRTHEMKPGRCPGDRVATVLWKTPSAQHFVVNRASTPLSDEPDRVQWRKLEDPYVSLCYVVEEEAATKTVTLRLWFQSFSPPTTPTQDTEIAHLIERKLRALDAAAATH